MTRPLVSVVMAVYRDRGALRDTINSVLDQDFDGLELIIINDASPDGTFETLKLACERDSRITLVENDVNLGLTKSLNRGLDVARGELIARIDEGDIWLPGKLTEQASFLIRNRAFVLVGSQYRNHVVGDAAPVRATRLPLDDYDVRRWLFCGLTPMTHPAIVFRNGLVKYNPLAITCQDFELYLRLSLLGKMCNLPGELVSVLRPLDAISVEKEEVQFFDHLLMHSQFLDVLKGRVDERRFVDTGVTFSASSWWLRLRRRYMAGCLNILSGPKVGRWGRVFKTALIPEIFIYFLRKRTAPYRLRKTYNAWVSRSQQDWKQPEISREFPIG